MIHYQLQQNTRTKKLYSTSQHFISCPSTSTSLKTIHPLSPVPSSNHPQSTKYLLSQASKDGSVSRSGLQLDLASLAYLGGTMVNRDCPSCEIRARSGVLEISMTSSLVAGESIDAIKLPSRRVPVDSLDLDSFYN